MQDAHVTSDPDVSFWKATYPRHSPFAQEPKATEATGTLGWGRKLTFEHDRIADCIQQAYLVYDINALNTTGAGVIGNSWADDVGRAAIEYIKLEIGHHEIDELTGEYMHIWEELSVLGENHYGALSGKYGNAADLLAAGQRRQKLYVPLPFYHTRHPSQALPSVALHLTKVQYVLKLRAFADLIMWTAGGFGTAAAAANGVVGTSDGAINDLFLMTNNIYLHQRERHWFTRVSHKYLIEQVQALTQNVVAGSTSARVQLDLNHPIKEIIIVGRLDSAVDDTVSGAARYFDFDGQEAAGRYTSELFLSMDLTINGNKRIDAQDPLYYRVVQPSQHHTRVPRKRIYVWSYALDPESINPTGSLNHSRIDRAILNLTFGLATPAAMTLFVYARNLNVSHIERGSFLLRFNS